MCRTSAHQLARTINLDASGKYEAHARGSPRDSSDATLYEDQYEAALFRKRMNETAQRAMVAKESLLHKARLHQQQYSASLLGVKTVSCPAGATPNSDGTSCNQCPTGTGGDGNGGCVACMKGYGSVSSSCGSYSCNNCAQCKGGATTYTNGGNTCTNGSIGQGGSNWGLIGGVLGGIALVAIIGICVAIQWKPKVSDKKIQKAEDQRKAAKKWQKEYNAWVVTGKRGPPPEIPKHMIPKDKKTGKRVNLGRSAANTTGGVVPVGKGQPMMVNTAVPASAAFVTGGVTMGVQQPGMGQPMMMQQPGVGQPMMMQQGGMGMMQQPVMPPPPGVVPQPDQQTGELTMPPPPPLPDNEDRTDDWN